VLRVGSGAIRTHSTQMLRLVACAIADEKLSVGTFLTANTRCRVVHGGPVTILHVASCSQEHSLELVSSKLNTKNGSRNHRN
jgi:hypothetical protein